jgi:hypothetical protein
MKKEPERPERKASMKKSLLVAMMCLLGVVSSPSADRRNFWLLNNTGRQINRVFIAAHGTETPWGDDVLGMATLPAGLGTAIYFSDSSASCVYDLQIEYADGSHDEYTRGRNLCTSHAVQFNRSTNDAF